MLKINFENETKVRKTLVNEICTKEGLLGKAAITRKEFYYIKVNDFFTWIFKNRMFSLQNESVLWCPVFKAASTSWILNLFNLMGLGENKTKELKNKYPGYYCKHDFCEIFALQLLCYSDN